MKKITLNETQLLQLIKKIVKESRRDPKETESMRLNLVDSVVNRFSEYGDEYYNALKQFNEDFPVTKIKILSPRDLYEPERVVPGVKTTFGKDF